MQQLLAEVTAAEMQILPSGLSLYDLLLDAHRDQGSIDNSNSTDPSNSLSPTSQQFISGASSLRGSVDSLSWTVAETGAETGTGTGTVNVVGSRAGTVTGAGTGAGAGAGAWGNNALMGILQRIPQRDLEALQRGVEIASASFRYYQYNSSLRLNDRDIPTRSTVERQSCVLRVPPLHRCVSYDLSNFKSSSSHKAYLYMLF